MLGINHDLRYLRDSKYPKYPGDWIAQFSLAPLQANNSEMIYFIFQTANIISLYSNSYFIIFEVSWAPFDITSVTPQWVWWQIVAGAVSGQSGINHSDPWNSTLISIIFGTFWEMIGVYNDRPLKYFCADEHGNNLNWPIKSSCGSVGDGFGIAYETQLEKYPFIDNFRFSIWIYCYLCVSTWGNRCEWAFRTSYVFFNSLIRNASTKLLLSLKDFLVTFAILDRIYAILVRKLNGA